MSTINFPSPFSSCSALTRIRGESARPSTVVGSDFEAIFGPARRTRPPRSGWTGGRTGSLNDHGFQKTLHVPSIYAIREFHLFLVRVIRMFVIRRIHIFQIREVHIYETREVRIDEIREVDTNETREVVTAYHSEISRARVCVRNPTSVHLALSAGTLGGAVASDHDNKALDNIHLDSEGNYMLSMGNGALRTGHPRSAVSIRSIYGGGCTGTGDARS